MSEILEKVCKTIEKHNLLEYGDIVLVALSGGADSVCLLTVLDKLKDKYGITLMAAHLNHMLRGAEADSDESFAKSLCEKLNIPFFSKKADVAKYAKEHMQTSEEAGRNLRYEFFSELSEKYGINKVATAHNTNDNVETVLMRFVRGTGVFGLAGIPYKNEKIIRPILDLHRSEIEEFLSDENICFVIDRTNSEPVYFRNKVRLSLIPEIEEKYNPNFKATLAQNIINYKESADFLKSITAEKVKSLAVFEKDYAYIDIDDFMKEHDYIKSCVIYSLLERFSNDKQATARSVRDIIMLAKKGDGAVNFSKEVNISVIYNKIFFIYAKEYLPFCYQVEKLQKIYLKECDKTVSFELVLKKEKNKTSIYVDYEKIAKKRVSIRNRKDGDFFIPSGMTGKKKVKDYFIDKKIPNFLRDGIPIILADDEIVCIGNMRESEKYKVTGDTNKILKIEISNGGHTNDIKRR